MYLVLERRDCVCVNAATNMQLKMNFILPPVNKRKLETNNTI
jgi:hypothetical protein